MSIELDQKDCGCCGSGVVKPKLPKKRITENERQAAIDGNHLNIPHGPLNGKVSSIHFNRSSIERTLGIGD